MRLTKSAIAAVVLVACSSASSGERPSAGELVAGLAGSAHSSASPQPDEKASAPRSGNRGGIFAWGIFREGDKPGRVAIASIEPETGAWIRLPVVSPEFDISPDGQTIVFSRENALWNCDTGESPNPGKIFSEDGLPVFSADGRSLLVTTWKRKAEDAQKQDTTVWKMAIDGANPTPQVQLAGDTVCACSPDGQWLVVRQEQPSIALVRTDGKERRHLVKFGLHPQFTPDGKSVVYVKQFEGAIRIVHTDGTNDRLLFQAPNLTFVLMARFSPDGKSLATVLRDLQLGDQGKPVFTADPKVSHPRIGIIDADSGDLRILSVPRQDGWDFQPISRLVWR
jgi:dipeptidyl aminopeptidase/acylaminoacyl peptidase